MNFNGRIKTRQSGILMMNKKIQRDTFFLIIIAMIATVLILTGGWLYLIAAVGIAVTAVAIAKWRRQRAWVCA